MFVMLWMAHNSQLLETTTIRARRRESEGKRKGWRHWAGRMKEGEVPRE